jgi:NTE family protein
MRSAAAGCDAALHPRRLSPIEQWRKQLPSDPRWARDTQAGIFCIELNLTDLDDPILRKRVLGIPTALRISEEDRALLRPAARTGLSRSADFAGFLRSLLAMP